MTRMEAAAWPLACGGACVFAIAVVLSGAEWTTAIVVLGLTVASWSLRAPKIAGVLLGGMAWLFLTGFDVNGDGELRFDGWHDAARLALLISAGLAGTMAARLVPGVSAKESRDG